MDERPTSLVVAQNSPYSPAEVERALSVLAVEGSSNRAADALKAEGLEVPARTLRAWRQTEHRERYLEIAARLQPEIEKAVVASTLDYLQESERVKADLLSLLAEQVDAKEVKDPAKSLQNLSVSQGIGLDSILKVQGRPTQLIQHSSVDESLATLQRLGIVVEGSAEEIEEAQVVEPESAEGGRRPAISPEVAEQTPDQAASS